MDAERELVFVYGTLRRSASNHFRMSSADFLGEGEIKGRLYKISWYPGLVLSEGGFVKGEIYSVDPEHLRKLDAFEGLPPESTVGEEYRRIRAMVSDTHGRSYLTWTWEWIGQFDEKDYIPQGDWIVPTFREE